MKRVDKPHRTVLQKTTGSQLIPADTRSHVDFKQAKIPNEEEQETERVGRETLAIGQISQQEKKIEDQQARDR